MQKYKKLLSVLLAMVMALSVMSAGLVAGAADLGNAPVAADAKDAAVTALENKINAYEGNMDTAEPTAEDKAGYDALIADFQKLSDAQKNSIDALALDKLTQLMYLYEQKIGTGTATENRKAAIAKILDTLKCPALDEAKKAADDGFFKSASYDEILAIYKSLSPLAKMMLNTGYSDAYPLFYTSLAADSDYVGAAFFTIVNRLNTEMKKADPFTGTQPNYKDYEGGRQDPAYIAAYREYYTGRYTHEIGILKDAIKKASEETGFANAADILAYYDKAVAAYEAFAASKDYTKAVEAQNYYASLDLETRMAIRGLRANVYFTYVGQSETATSPKTFFGTKLFTEVANASQFAKVGELEEYIKTVNEPYTAEAAAKVTEMYLDIPEVLRAQMDAVAYEKVQAVIFYGRTNVASDEKPELPKYEKTEVTYPIGASYEKTTGSIPKMDDLVNKIASLAAGSDLSTLLTTGLYTNATIEAIAKKLLPLLGDAGITDGSPAGLLARLEAVEDNGAYEGAKAALADKATWDEVTFKNGDFFLDGDKDGFVNALTAVLRVLADLKYTIDLTSRIFNALNLESKYDEETTEYSVGTYENLVHIFEDLGIECIDSVEYSKGVAAGIDKYEKMDARLSPILEAVINFLDKAAANPVSVLTDVLPRLAYILNDGSLNTNIRAITDGIADMIDELTGGFIGGFIPADLKATLITVMNMLYDLDITSTGLFNTIGSLEKLGLTGIVYDEPSNSAEIPNYIDKGTLTITVTLQEAVYENDKLVSEAITTDIVLQEADFIQFMKDAAGCGELQVIDSICFDNAYRVGVKSDKADAFVTAVRYIYDDVLMKNPTAVKDIIDYVNPKIENYELKEILKSLFDVIQANLPADALILALVTLADPMPDFGDIELPDIGGGEGGLDDIFQTIGDFIAGIIGGDTDIGGIFGGIIDFISGLFGGGDDNGDDDNNGGNNGNNTDDPSIPNTAGSKALASILVFGVLGVLGAGAGACVYKFKKDDEE